MPHFARPPLPKGVPVHVTLALAMRLPSLRRPAEKAALFAAFLAGRERFGFRLVHCSVQSNHVHLIAEAADKRSLARGVQALAVRMARGLNRVWRRQGRVFADRFHAAQLRAPRAVRNAIAYVLLNHRRHGSREPGPDVYSSGAWFSGWRGGTLHGAVEISPTVEPRCWLLTTGWKRWRLIGQREIPGPDPSAGR